MELVSPIVLIITLFFLVSFLMRNTLQSTYIMIITEFWQHTLGGSQWWKLMEHSVPPVQCITVDCKGWWLVGSCRVCGQSAAISNLELWVQFMATALFHLNLRQDTDLRICAN